MQSERRGSLSLPPRVACGAIIPSHHQLQLQLRLQQQQQQQQQHERHPIIMFSHALQPVEFLLSLEAQTQTHKTTTTERLQPVA